MIWIALAITWAGWALLMTIWAMEANRRRRSSSNCVTAILPVFITFVILAASEVSPLTGLWTSIVANALVVGGPLSGRGLNKLRYRKQMNKLYEKIFDAGCIKFGEFKLKSGIMSPVYCDFRGLVSKPELLKEIGEALGRRAEQIGYSILSGGRLAGIPYAGLPLAVAASLASGVPMIYPRKEVKDYGTKKLIEGEYAEGDRVLVIDDIITDGASKIEAIAPLKEAGLVVEDVLIILDREQGGDKILAKAGYKLHSLGKLSEVLDALVDSGKVEASMREAVAKFISENQFA